MMARVLIRVCHVSVEKVFCLFDNIVHSSEGVLCLLLLTGYGLSSVLSVSELGKRDRARIVSL